MEIGIIGSGAAGVSLLDALSLSDTRPGGITVFDGAPSLWRGRAYQSDLEAVLVNAPPMLMSVRHGDLGHYQRWLAGHERGSVPDPWLGVPIVPRSVYGEYLEATAREAIDRLEQAGWRVRVVRDRVVGYDPVRTADGATHAVDQVVLCVGGGRPLDLYGLAGRPGFVLEPYPLAGTLDDLPADARVAVIGSGLTAVDVVAALTARGHTGPVTLLSRRGLLPDVQQAPARLDFRHLSPADLPDTLAGLAVLLKAELADLGQDLDPLLAEITSTEDPVTRLRRQLTEVASPYLGRRLLVAAIHLFGTAAWRRLAPAERAALRTEHFRTVTRTASPMIPGNAELLRRQFDSGRLRLLAGQPVIRPGRAGFRVGGPEDFDVDVVINAVNPPAHAVPASAAALVSSLEAAGDAVLGPDGGLAARSPRVHTVGALTADTSFVTPSVPTLAATAHTVAAGLFGAGA